ncbi:hypothetical protein ABW20_dc0110309 [Dactylellina cionopaga]|nr:hypothetical protein ABW20_dc0110309 [Dactylellina cionopaga]
MAPDVLGLGPPSKKRRVSPDGEAASMSADSSRMQISSSQSQPLRRRKLPPIARQHLSSDAAPVLPAEIIEPLFEQSIALVLKSCGFDGGSKLALNSVRLMAGQYLQDITANAMTYCAMQRRTRPTIIDFEETLKNTGFDAVDFEDEVTRYRKSLQSAPPPDTSDGIVPPPSGNSIIKTKPHIYNLPDPDPASPEEPSLQELLGPELLKPRKRYKLPIPPRPTYMAKLEQDHPGNPKFAAPTKQITTVYTERPYIEAHHPPWPGKHTYERHEEVTEVVRDAKKIRELASEEARQSGETLRKLLAEFSKVSTATRKGTGETNGNAPAKKSGSEVYKGGNARQKRDVMFEKTWEKVIKAMEVEKEKEKADREEKKQQRRERRERAKKAASAVNGLFGASSMMEIDFDEESSEDEGVEEIEKETQIDDKGLLDTVVNCEKGLWAKGGMRRVMIR